MINNTQPISFQGLKISGTVSAKNIHKLADFTKATENLGFIKDLEKDFNTNIVLNGELDKISFSHEKYGDLTKYNCPVFPAKDFYSNVVTAIGSIKSAIKKAEKASKSSNEETNNICRGC